MQWDGSPGLSSNYDWAWESVCEVLRGITTDHALIGSFVLIELDVGVSLVSGLTTHHSPKVLERSVLHCFLKASKSHIYGCGLCGSAQVPGRCGPRPMSHMLSGLGGGESGAFAQDAGQEGARTWLRVRVSCCRGCDGGHEAGAALAKLGPG